MTVLFAAAFAVVAHPWRHTAQSSVTAPCSKTVTWLCRLPSWNLTRRAGDSASNTAQLSRYQGNLLQSLRLHLQLPFRPCPKLAQAASSPNTDRKSLAFADSQRYYCVWTTQPSARISKARMNQKNSRTAGTGILQVRQGAENQKTTIGAPLFLSSVLKCSKFLGSVREELRPLS